MYKLSVVILVIVAALAGCKKKEDSTATSTATPAGSAEAAGSAVAADQGPPASCKDAGKNYAKLLSADPTTDLGKAEPGMQGLMKYSYEEACDTEWSDANKSCVAKAKSSAEARNCFDSKMAERFDAMGLRKQLVNLKPEQRSIIDLAYFNGYTQDEISKEMGIPLGTVKTRMRTAILELRKILNKD